MTFFNLKRLARLLAILLAILPISELVAASPSITQASASNIVQDLSSQYQSDAATIVAAAGIPGALISSGALSASTGANLATKLTYVFNSAYTSNRSAQNKIPNLVTAAKAYASATSSAIASTSTVSLVQTAMQNLMSLMALTLLNIGTGRIALSGQTLPLTGVAILPASSQDYDQVVVNNFVQELAAWIPYYQAVVSGNIANLNNQMLQNAATQLGLTPASNMTLAQAMQNVINAATNDSSALYGAAGTACSNNTTIQKQINCAIAWYQAQLNIIVSNTNNGVIRNIAPSIDPTTSSIFTITTPSASAALALNTPATSSAPVTSSIDAATANLNEIDATATATIKGYVATYSPKITAATDSATVNSVFSTALGLINAAYPALSSTSGTIAAQNNAVSSLESAVNSAVAALTKLPSTPFNIAHTAYTTAQTNFSNAYTAATTDFPVDLPVSNGVGTLTATTASAYGASVPGAQVEALATDQTNALNTINNNNNNATIASVTANTAALNGAVTAAEQLFTSYTSAPATITLVGTATGLASAIAQVNTYYTQTIAAGSAYTTALANANTLLTQLNGMQSVTPQPTGLASAISTMQTAISAANTAFPQASSAITFTVANSAAGQTYATSVPGIAVTALNAITTTNNNNNATIASVTANTAALNGAVTTAEQLFTTYTSGLTTAAAITKAGGLQATINQVNTYYTQTIAAGSAYVTALANANTLLKQLSSLQSQNPQPTGLASAISTMQTAINAANNAFPQSIPAITFTVANSAAGQAYANTVPGTAITALNAAASKSGGSSGLSAGAITGITLGIIAVLLGVGVFALYKAGKWPFSQSIEDQAKAIGEKYTSQNTLDTDSEDFQNALTEVTNGAIGTETTKFLTDNPSIFQDIQTTAINSKCGPEVNPGDGQLDISEGNMEVFNDLVNGYDATYSPSGSTPESFTSALDQVVTEITSGVGDYSPDNIMTMLTNSSQYLPAEASGLSNVQQLDLIKSTISGQGITSSLSDDGFAGRFQEAATNQMSVNETVTNKGITAANVETYQEAINKAMADDPSLTFAQAKAQVDGLLESTSGQNYSMDDMLDILTGSATSTGSNIFPADDQGDLMKQLTDLSTAINTGGADGNGIPKPANGVSDETFLSSLENAIANPVANGPTGGQVTGPAQDIEGADLFNDLAKARTEFSQSSVVEEIQSQGLSMPDFQAQMRALVAEREKIATEEGDDSADVKALDAQIAAGNEAGSDQFSGEGYDPIEPVA